MKSKLCAGLIAGVALFYCNLRGTCEDISPEIRFRLVRETLIVISVQANGQGPFDFFLDTGSDATIIDPSLAEGLGLNRFGHALQVSLGDSRMVERSRLSKFRVGAAEVDGLPVLIEDLSSLRQSMPGIRGIVGQQFLSHFNYLLDYRKRSIRLEEGSELRDNIEGSRVPLELRQGPGSDMMIVVADASAVHHARIRLILDSGATNLMLMRDASQRLEVPVKKTLWEQTAVDSKVVHCGPVHLVTIGTEQLQDVTTAISTESASAFGDGLLPTSLFRATYFNNREGFVIFNPRAKGNFALQGVEPRRKFVATPIIGSGQDITNLVFISKP